MPQPSVKILLTRSSDKNDKSAEVFKNGGFEVFSLSCLQIEGVRGSVAKERDAALHRLSDAAYAAVAFTSATAVGHFVSRLRELSIQPPWQIPIFAIGQKTGGALMQAGAREVKLAEGRTGEELGQTILKTFQNNLKGLRILLPRALNARRELPELLRMHDATAVEAFFYQTTPVKTSAQLPPEPLWVVCASPSAIEGFLQRVGREVVHKRLQDKTLRFACIGPTTAKALAQSLEVSDAIISPEPNFEALADHLKKQTWQ